jgi:hypothetical protein
LGIKLPLSWGCIFRRIKVQKAAFCDALLGDRKEEGALTKLSALDALKDFLSDPLLGVRATILLRIDWHSGLIGALLW